MLARGAQEGQQHLSLLAATTGSAFQGPSRRHSVSVLLVSTQCWGPGGCKLAGLPLLLEDRALCVLKYAIDVDTGLMRCSDRRVATHAFMSRHIRRAQTRSLRSDALALHSNQFQHISLLSFLTNFLYPSTPCLPSSPDPGYGGSTCTQCQPGSYSPGATTQPCQSCGPGQTSQAGATGPEWCQCPAGQGLEDADNVCDTCPPGTYQSGPLGTASVMAILSAVTRGVGLSRCRECPGNQTSPAGSTSVSDCGALRYT